MKFPWEKYEELPTERRNTLQIFITNRCNLKCDGCFARKIIGENRVDMSMDEYRSALEGCKKRGGKQITLIGGEPLLHPDLRDMIKLNLSEGIKTTIYTNGYFLKNYTKEDFEGVKLRVSVYCKGGVIKALDNIPKTDIPFDVCFMVSRKTTIDELIKSAEDLEKAGCRVFFISSLRELDNPNQEFFEDTDITMNLLDYKKLVHGFLRKYNGNMEIHVSKRGVFESTRSLTGNKCKFANYFIGGKIIQCPYDIVNLKFQDDYVFDCRNCQHSNSCLMTKVVYKRNSSN